MPKSLFVDPALTRAAGKITFEDIPVNVYNKTIKEERKRYSDDDLVRPLPKEPSLPALLKHAVLPKSKVPYTPATQVKPDRR